MKTNKRWLDSVLKAAKTSDTPMPWERGERRAEMIARRDTTEDLERLSA